MRAKLEQSEVEIQEAETIPGMPSPMKESTVKVEKVTPTKEAEGLEGFEGLDLAPRPVVVQYLIQR